MKKYLIAVMAAFLAFTFVLTACDDFVSGTSGNFREYEEENINVTPGNLDQWVQRVVGNQPLAELVSQDIIRKLRENTYPQDRLRFQRAGMKIASESSGLGVSLLSNALGAVADLVDLFTGEEDPTVETLNDVLKEVFNRVQDDFREAGGVQAAAAIAEILSYDIQNTDSVPTFSPLYAESVTPAEVTKAVMVLIMGELDHINVENIELGDISQIARGLVVDLRNLRIVVNQESEVPPSDTAIALAAFINLIASDPVRFMDNPFTKGIGETFNVAS